MLKMFGSDDSVDESEQQRADDAAAAVAAQEAARLEAQAREVFNHVFDFVSLVFFVFLLSFFFAQ